MAIFLNCCEQSTPINVRFLLAEPGNPFVSTVGEVAGFSLHAGVAARANERNKLERLCRDVTSPPVSTGIPAI